MLKPFIEQAYISSSGNWTGWDDCFWEGLIVLCIVYCFQLDYIRRKATKNATDDYSGAACLLRLRLGIERGLAARFTISMDGINSTAIIGLHNKGPGVSQEHTRKGYSNYVLLDVKVDQPIAFLFAILQISRLNPSSQVSIFPLAWLLVSCLVYGLSHGITS